MAKKGKLFFRVSLRVLLVVAAAYALMSIWYSPTAVAQDQHSSEQADQMVAIDQEENQDVEVEISEFKASEMIFDHILDAHEWHFATLSNGHHISIYLPVILWNEGTLHFFSSEKLAHGHTYTTAGNTFALLEEGDNAGKIVAIGANGEEQLPLDFSITKNVAAIFIGSIFILWLFIAAAKGARKSKGKAPKGVLAMVEPLILFVRDDIAIPSIGKEKANRYLPYLLTTFFFIFINNLLGMIPGWANVTGNISVTLVLALFTFVIITFSGNKAYWMHIVNAPGIPWWLKFPLPLMPIVELMGVITKPFVLMVRLFANMTAGHIVVLAFVSMIFIFGEMSAVAGYGVSIFSVLMSVFIYLLELLVAFIQAYVFTLLSALYFGMATEEHH